MGIIPDAILACASCTALGYYLRFMYQSYKFIQEEYNGREN